MLTDMPDARRLLNDDLAGIRISLAQNQAEERLLAGAVGSNAPDTLTGIDTKVDLTQNLLRAIPHADITKLNHGEVSC